MEYVKNVESVFRLSFFHESGLIDVFFFSEGKNISWIFSLLSRKGCVVSADGDNVHHVIRSLHFLLLPVETATLSGRVAAEGERL